MVELPASERQPACVLACPTHARHYGDFDDPDSKVSQLTSERGGFGLLESLGYRPVNRYLPPRAAPVVEASAAPQATEVGALARLMSLARAAIGR